MTKFFLGLGLLLILSVSCSFEGSSGGLLSSRVIVVPAPYGVGDTIRPSRPTIFLSKGKYTCRPRPINPKIMVGYLKKTDLSDEGLASIFGFSVEEINFIEEQEQSRNRRINLKPIRVDVGEEGKGWLKLGLFISNGNAGSDNQNFFLIIDSVGFVATAQYRDQVFQASNDIQAGYCAGGESLTTSEQNSETEENSDQYFDLGSPFLYIVPPGTKVEYNPTSSNPFHNLTLYLTGFPIIDRSGELSPDQERRISGVTNQNSESSTSENKFKFRAGDPLRIIPRYTVDLTLRGHFTTSEGDLVAAFTKRVRFFTQSSTEF